MLYNLSIILSTDGDFEVSEDVIKQENGKAGFEDYRFNWTIQADTPKEIAKIAEEKVRAVQNGVNIFIDYIEEDVSNFFERFYYALNQNPDLKNCPIYFYMFGNYDCTCISLVKTNFVTT